MPPAATMSAARTSEGTGAGRRPSTVSKHPVVGKLGGEPDLLSSSVPDTPPDASSSSTESLLAALATVSSPSDDLPPLLSALHARESALLSRLQSLRATHQSQLLSRDLSRLDALRTSSLTSRLLPAARSLADATVGPAASTAARLGNRVRTLDVEKARVEATLRAVEAVAELKACVLGVVGSMGAPQDWEAAAAYVARAERVEKMVVESEFARRTVPSVEVPDPPATVLEDAKESLCGLFLREFERAAEDVSKAGADQEKAADAGARVTRFFKLFPLIGRGDVGLDVYGRYVCQGVAGTARAVLREGAPATGSGSGTLGGREGYFYAAALTRLFEHVARVVADHGALVERHYGKGRMVRVIGRLQAEVDVQAGIVLDTWSDERGVDRRLTDVRSYPFSFLVQSFLPVQTKTSSVLAGVGVGGIGTPRINSPAVGASTADNARNSEDEGVNMKEVDALLAEIAVMLGRWSLYARFLAGKCRVGGVTVSHDFRLSFTCGLSLRDGLSCTGQTLVMGTAFK